MIDHVRMQQQATARRLMTVADVAQKLQVHTKTVVTWAHQGRLPKPVVFGRTLRWRPEDIDAAIAEASKI